MVFKTMFSWPRWRTLNLIAIICLLTLQIYFRSLTNVPVHLHPMTSNRTTIQTVVVPNVGEYYIEKKVPSNNMHWWSSSSLNRSRMQQEYYVSLNRLEFQYNMTASDAIPVNRSVPDLRDPNCKNSTWNGLSPTSIIITFYSEAWSVLLRTVHSIVAHTPLELIHEILLVDDASEREYLQAALQKYMSQFPKVTIIRLVTHVGQPRSRLIGAHYATGKILTFLDSHCECGPGWVQPLLSRISENPTTIVVPELNVIDPKTFEYYPRFNSSRIGGFTWKLEYVWIKIQEDQNITTPIPTTTFLSHVFSIDREFFDFIGKFDSRYNIPIVSSLELSFKTWMCGFRIELIRCSQVGYIERGINPLEERNPREVITNYVRLAEVWMDSYSQYFYEVLDIQNLEIYTHNIYEELMRRKKVRENIQCRSFQWFLKNVTPGMFTLDNTLARGKVTNYRSTSEYRKCLMADFLNLTVPIFVQTCHTVGETQYWFLKYTGEICRLDDFCLNYNAMDSKMYVTFKGNQTWKYLEQKLMIRHEKTGKCLGVDSKEQVILDDCESVRKTRFGTSNDYLKWTFQYFNSTGLMNYLIENMLNIF